jgi:short-subunit dehydrogenase
MDAARGTAVVTGAASGIGLALSRALGAAGSPVALADRDETALEAAVDELRDMGIDAMGVATDVTDQASVDALARAATARGPVATLCLNAGVTSAGPPLWEASEESLRFVLDVNLWGLLRCIRAFVPTMIEQDAPAHIVITASMAGLVTSGHAAGYAASKAAAVAIGKGLRAELAVAAPAIKVTILAPGMVKTNLMRTSAALDPARPVPASAEAGHEALNTFGLEPDEVAEHVLDALRHDRPWVLPPAGDPFSSMLAAELDELRAALGS